MGGRRAGLSSKRVVAGGGGKEGIGREKSVWMCVGRPAGAGKREGPQERKCRRGQGMAGALVSRTGWKERAHREWAVR